MTVKEMESAISPLIGAFKQHLEIHTTSPEMLDSELFPDRERRHESQK